MLTAAALAGGFGPGTVPAARAAGYVYQQHVVNAGVLVNGSDPAPYLFYVLNNRPDVRQPDLTLINPLAPSGANPNTEAYWEVSLNNVFRSCCKRKAAPVCGQRRAASCGVRRGVEHERFDDGDGGSVHRNRGGDAQPVGGVIYVSAGRPGCDPAAGHFAAYCFPALPAVGV